jgi:REP element-mobilizing transposase RayT
MVRPLRIKYEGAIYHVFSRGNRKTRIFPNRETKEYFIKRLGQGSTKFGVMIHAYCIMDNHYHLLLQTVKPNISEFMHYLGSAYAVYMSKMGWAGHVFAGRYEALCVEEGRYFLESSRYIHLNPVRAEIADRPQDYPWSSYQCFIGITDRPEWLEVDATLGHFGLETEENRSSAVDSYNEFVMRGMPGADDAYRILARAIWGSEEHAEKVRSMLKGESLPKEFIGKRHLRKAISLQDAYRKTLEVFGLSSLRREKWQMGIDRGLLLEARRAFIFLAREYAGATNGEIASMIGDIGDKTVSHDYLQIKRSGLVEGSRLWELNRDFNATIEQAQRDEEDMLEECQTKSGLIEKLEKEGLTLTRGEASSSYEIRIIGADPD